MLKIKISYFLLVSICFAMASNVEKSLSDLYEDKFLIGNILSGGIDGDSLYRNDKKELRILSREYNCLTAENLMKMQYLQPKEGEYYFDAADNLVNFAEYYNMEIVGHALVWHHQVPDWLFKYKDGSQVSREDLIQRMKEHITKVMTRYKGRIKYWDVVNEAVNLKTIDGKQVAYYRDSLWYQIIGPEYIELAYSFAQEADPDALLLYNDYSMADIPKTRFVANMVKNLKASGINIHGIGMQAHWHLAFPGENNLREALDILKEVGVQISITELDIGVIPREMGAGADLNLNKKRAKELDPFTRGIPKEVLKEHAERYASLFRIFLEYDQYIERVTFWGVLDHYSWLKNWPIQGRTVYPALFDKKYKAKPAYYAIRKLVE